MIRRSIFGGNNNKDKNNDPLRSEESNKDPSTVIIKQGSLTKDGGLSSSWKKRTFILTKNGELKYYDSSNSFKGEFKIDGGTTVTPVVLSGVKRPYCFALIMPDRTCYLAADSASLMNEWISAMTECGAKRLHDNIIKEGPVTKESGRNSACQLRHFVLTGNKEMIYYEGITEKGRFSINGAQLNIEASRQNRDNCFSITTQDRTYYLSTESQSEMRDWIDKLVAQGAVQSLRKASSVAASRISELGAADIIMEGNMSKEGGSRAKLKMRYFVLSLYKKELSYFTKQDGVLKGSLSVANAHVSPLPTRYHNCFQVETKDRTYYFVACSEESMWEWIDKLGQCGAITAQIEKGDNVILKQGELKKRGGEDSSKPFKRRYFQLTAAKNLKYYLQMGDVLKGTIKVENCVIYRYKNDPSKRNHFDLEVHERTYKIQADTEHEANEWIDTLVRECKASVSDVDATENARIADGDKLAAAASASEADEDLSKTRVFGVNLAEVLARDNEVLPLPMVAETLISWMEKYGCDVEGIFRVPGSSLAIKATQKRFDRGEKVEFTMDTDINVVAALLKLYVKELPVPLLTYEYYDSFIAAMSKQFTHEERIQILAGLVHSLPAPNYAFLARLMRLMNMILENRAINKMSASNLSIVFGLNLMRAPPSGNENSDSLDTFTKDSSGVMQVFECLLVNYKQIFEPDAYSASESAATAVSDDSSSVASSYQSQQQYFTGSCTSIDDNDEPPPPPPPPQQQLTVSCYARALFDFAASSQSVEPELSFKQGEILAIVDTSAGDGWWTAQNASGQVGIIPQNYVDIIENQ